MHGEMLIGDGPIMLASPSPNHEGPRRHHNNCGMAASWSALPRFIDGVLIHAEAIDKHYPRTSAAGATAFGHSAERIRIRHLSRCAPAGSASADCYFMCTVESVSERTAASYMPTSESFWMSQTNWIGRSIACSR